MLELLSYENILAFAALTVLEIVLGIDNIIFLAILVDRLPAELQSRGRIIGLSLAMVLRIGLLLTISLLMLLSEPFFTILGNGFSGRDIILLVGGLFLIWKATSEIHQSMEDPEEEVRELRSGKARFWNVIAQILVIDLVFSLDSVITAVGLVDEVYVMIAAIIIAVIIMMFFAKYINDFIAKHPTLKMLALSFLILAGVVLVADGLGVHVNRGYIYFAMTFSLSVETLNIRRSSLRKKLSGGTSSKSGL